jgi:hypothetical protein
VKTKPDFSEIRYLLRISADNQWREARLEEVIDAKFGSPFSCANAIVVGYFRKNQSFQGRMISCKLAAADSAGPNKVTPR